jgi:hypothetical protein
MTIARYLNYTAAAFGFAAAVLWFVSAFVRTPSSFSVAVDISAATWDASVGGVGYSQDLSDLGDALKHQSRLSAYAAACAGMAAILGAAALTLGDSS